MITILGATGKAGKASIRELRRAGVPVRAVVRDLSKATDLATLGCEMAVADFENSSALRTALEGSEVIQVICPMSIHAEQAETEMDDLINTIAEALEAARPATIVAISDYGAQVEKGTGVTMVFHRLENRLKKIAASLALLRSAEQMQNWSRHIRTAAETGFLPCMHHPVTKRFPTVAAEDVGKVAAELILTAKAWSGLRIVHVEGPRRYTPEEVAEAFRLLVDRDVAAQAIPREGWIPSLLRGGLGRSYAQLVAELYDAHNAGLIEVEAGVGEVRRGERTIEDVFTSLRGLASEGKK